LINNDYILLILLITLSAFFSHSETALFSLTKLKLERIKKNHQKTGLIISKLINNPQKLLVTILICNLGINMSATLIAVRTFPSFIAVPLITILIIIIGEITPKTMAINFAYYTVPFIAPVIYFLYIILTPFSFVFHKITEKLVNVSSRLFYRTSKGEVNINSNEEVIDVIKESQENGTLHKEEGIILSNLLSFSETDISTIIKPRNSIFSISIEEKLIDIIEKIKEKKFSRVPVWEDNEENIVGILFAKDLINIKNLKKKLVNYKNLLRKPYFVPDTIKAEQLLKNLQITNSHIAIVIDEYSQIAGLVTLEDVLEEIIGEIVDKDDVIPLYYKYNSRMIEVEAKMEIKELNKVFKTNLKSKEAVTVGGYILEKINRIPRNGELILLNNLQFTISNAMPNKIEKIMITKMNRRRKKRDSKG
jgi:putative hemolysin